MLNTVSQPYKTYFIQQAVEVKCCINLVIQSTVGVDDIRKRTSSIEIPRSEKEKETISQRRNVQGEREKILWRNVQRETELIIWWRNVRGEKRRYVIRWRNVQGENDMIRWINVQLKRR